MPSPFPGMDPYLENSSMWPDLHHRLITAIADEISAQLSRNYYVAIEKRIYLSEPDEQESFRIPDVSVLNASDNGDVSDASLFPATDREGNTAVAVRVPIPEEVHEGYLELREAGSNYLITAIEVLSPTNKRPGAGRDMYEEKRMELLGTWTNLVEIDLLRAGEPMRIISNGIHSDYRVLVTRGGRSRAMLYPFGVRQPFPKFPVPLRRGDRNEPVVNIGMMMPDIYDRARYYMQVNYAENPEPPLSGADAAWADQLLRGKALR